MFLQTLIRSGTMDSDGFGSKGGGEEGLNHWHNLGQLSLDDKGFEIFSRRLRAVAESKVDVLSFSKSPKEPGPSMFLERLDVFSCSEPPKEPGPPMFLEKLPREIRTIIYNYFLMPRWVFNIPKSQRAHGGGYAPQELIDNSLESCLSSELLNICTQIRREYKEDAFRVLPTRIYCTGSAVNRSIPFSSSQLKALVPLLNHLVHDIGKAQSAVDRLFESKGIRALPRLKYTSYSIASNLNLVRHLDISVKINSATTSLSQPRKAVSMARKLVTAEMPSITGPDENRLLFSKLTRVSISIDLEDIYPAGTLAPDLDEFGKMMQHAFGKKLGCLWTKGSLEQCSVVACYALTRDCAPFRSKERRIPGVRFGEVRTMHVMGDSNTMWAWDVKTGKRKMVEAVIM